MVKPDNLDDYYYIIDEQQYVSPVLVANMTQPSGRSTCTPSDLTISNSILCTQAQIALWLQSIGVSRLVHFLFSFLYV